MYIIQELQNQSQLLNNCTQTIGNSGKAEKKLSISVSSLIISPYLGHHALLISIITFNPPLTSSLLRSSSLKRKSTLTLKDLAIRYRVALHTTFPSP